MTREFTASVDVTRLARRLSEVERRQLPFAIAQTMNEAAFEVRRAWSELIPRVFDQPTAFTRNAVLYTKATKARPVAEVFLRNEASKGTITPAQYLEASVRGGQRAAKRSEVLLRKRGILGPREYVVPAKDYPLDGSGNIPARVYRTILTDLEANFDPARNSTRESRAKRARRRNIGKRGVYFYWPGDSGQGRSKHSLPRGIYERIATGFGSGIRMVLAIVGRATYTPRYVPFDLSRRVFWREYGRRFRANLARAVDSAR